VEASSDGCPAAWVCVADGVVDDGAEGVVSAPASTEPTASVVWPRSRARSSLAGSPLATDGSTPMPPSIAMPVTLSEAHSTATRP
jgi:hypothetical protein